MLSPLPPRSRVLVTGASGFVGRHALASLRALGSGHGFEVHAVSRAAPGSLEDGVHWHAADLLRPGAARALLARAAPTHLLHLAWYAEHGKYWESPLNLAWREATVELARAFAEAGGRRFVGAGTSAEYDWGERNDAPRREDELLRPATLYGKAKAETCAAVAALCAATGVSFAWARLFHLFGPGEMPTRLGPALYRAHRAGAAFDAVAGERVLDFLPAEAAGEALARLCLVEGLAAEGAVNVGSGRATTLRAFSERLSRIAGREGAVRFGARADAGPVVLTADIARLRAATGWEPPDEEEFEAALRRAAAAWERGEKGNAGSA